jgi:hypothetical protein
MKPGINELKKLLEQASVICEDNLEVENIDLSDMMDTLDNYVDELCNIGEFVVYEEDDE